MTWSLLHTSWRITDFRLISESAAEMLFSQIRCLWRNLARSLKLSKWGVVDASESFAKALIWKRTSNKISRYTHSFVHTLQELWEVGGKALIWLYAVFGQNEKALKWSHSIFCCINIEASLLYSAITLVFITELE